MFYKKKGEKSKYEFLDQLCIGRKCFAPGWYSHYGTAGGVRYVRHRSPQCMNRAYRGCNLERNPYDVQLQLQNKISGWKVVR